MRVYRIGAILFALTGAGAAAARQVESPPSPPPAAYQKLIANYTRWTRVNHKPHRVESQLAVLCRSVTAQERIHEASNPHNDKWVTVYVNQPAERAMLNQKQPTFPQGSVVVKRKMAEADSDAAELLTVMRKREKGYNPAGGDWEYLVFDGAGKPVGAQGRLQACQSCHARWKASDYISRAYFTEAMKRRLR